MLGAILGMKYRTNVLNTLAHHGGGVRGVWLAADGVGQGRNLLIMSRR